MNIIDRLQLRTEPLMQFCEKNYKKIVLAMLIVQGLLLVVFWAFNGFHAVYFPDTETYVIPARNLIEVGKLLDGNLNPILFRTPGYSLFLALIYLITDCNDNAVVLLQFLMVLGTSYLIFSLVAAISKKKWVGCAALFFYMCELTVYTHAVCILTDTVFPFLLVAALWMLYKYYVKHKLKYFVGSVVLVNYALLVRPQIMYFNIILVLVLVLLAILNKVGWRVCIIYCSIFALTFGGWSVRNYCVFGNAMYSSVRAESYFKWFAPVTYARVENVSHDEAYRVFDEMMEGRYPNYAQLPQIDRIIAEKEIGLSYIKENMGAYILLNLDGLVKELFAPDMHEIYSWNLPIPLYWLTNCLFGGILLLSYIIYAVGFLRSLTRHTWLDWLILLTVMYLMASTAVLGYCRYRLAFYSLCVIGAFSCWKPCLKKKKE